MLLPNIKAVFIASFWIAALCDARFLDWSPSSRDVVHENRGLLSFWERQSDEGDVCEIVCSPSSCAGGSCPVRRRRDLPSLDFNETAESEGLFKRVFQNIADNNVGSYIAGHQETIQSDADNGLDRTIAPAYGGGYKDPTYCIQQSFRALGPNDLTDGVWRIGTGSGVLLEGCTVLVVVSARAVYMCHIWEDAHMEPSWSERYVSMGPALNLIEGRAGDRRETAGPSLAPELFNQPGDNTRIFIMTPRDKGRPDDAAGYHWTAEVGMLTGSLTRLLPGAASAVQYNYDNDLDRNYAPWRGQALFEYDRNGAGAGRPDWRLWLEGASTTGRAQGQNVQ